jgi:hypothetical protein
MGNTNRILVGKLEGKRPLRRHRHWWEDNSKMDLGEIGCGQGHSNIPSSSIEGW